MRNKITVSIGIPAFNEEANIKRLLLALLAQKQINFNLQEIIVVSDGSTDRTVQEAKSTNDRRITVIEGKNRRGQAFRQNEVFERASTNFVVLLNADILIKDNDFLSKMVDSCKHTVNAGIVSAKILPNPSGSLVGRILEWHIHWKRQLYEQINNGDNIYLCSGLARGFSKKAYRGFRWPQSWAEDAFSYLAIKRAGLQFKYCKEAIVYYQPPQNLKDHARQSVRFMYSSKELSSFFSKEELKIEYYMPKKMFTKFMIKGLIDDPLKALSYLGIYAYCKVVAVFAKTNNNSDLWQISSSTKKLNTGTKDLN